MNEFLDYIVKEIVKDTESVEITTSDDAGLTTYHIKVSDDDMGLLIGKNGKTINSIRSLIRAKAIKDGVRVRVEIIDNK